MQSTNALVRRAALVLGLAGFALMTFYVVALFAAPAQAESNSSPGKVQYQQQSCQAIVRQRNNLVNNGSASATGGAGTTGGNATATISQKLNVPVSVVQNCLQAGGNINSGGSNNGSTSTTTPKTDETSATGGSGGSQSSSAGLLADSYPQKPLPVTGGTTAVLVPAAPVSAVLIPVGGF